jgi:hypothetical protein
MEVRESAIECPQCKETLFIKDIAAYQGLCWHCFCDVEEQVFAKREGYVYGDVAHMARVIELEEDQRDGSVYFGVDDPFHGGDLTVCCDEDPENCECQFPEKAPVFDEALEKYLGLLPDDIYDTSNGVPCISSCDNAWMGGCTPLRKAFHLIHMHQEMINAGSENPEELYVGSIDGCINYTQRIEDHRVAHVRIRRDS